MKKLNNNFTLISNIVCFLLLLVMLATQFLPFWLCEDCKTHDESKMVSISEYTWFPKKHTPITKGMTSVYLDVYGDDYKDEKGKAFKFQANDTIVPCVLVYAACILTIVMLIARPKNPLNALFPLVGGAACTIGYLTIPALQVGQNWQIHLTVAIVLTAVAGGSVIYHAVKGILAFVKKTKE